MRVRLLLLGGLLALVTSCAATDEPEPPTPSPSDQDSPPATPSESPTDSPAALVMPDLTGLPSATVTERLGELGLGSTWGRPVVVRCEVRPRAVVRQRPAPGTPITPDTTVLVRTAALDLDVFRGPCEPKDEYVGPMADADVALARDFYRFAADPSLGAPFASGTIWVGIEDGQESTSIGGAELGRLMAWELDAQYAEASGPFSALDLVAASGGYFELSKGVAPTCGGGDAKAFPELVGLRPLSLTAPEDVTSSCIEWWGVTLFLDAQDRIKGVALRQGAP